MQFPRALASVGGLRMGSQCDRYPKPGPIGGTLLRRAVALLRRAGVELPLANSDILIALSGGPDSVALARLLVRYGRRIAPRGALGLLHLNHGWRKEGAKKDEIFVRALARRWDVPLEVIRLPPPREAYAKGESWEARARALRQEVYKRMAAAGARIFTAHHADDLAETVLWRLLTAGRAGALGGIAVTTNAGEVRPLLTTRKWEIVGFLREEGLQWRDDESNHDERFLRARLRARVMPELEKIFPRGVARLTELALAAQFAEQGDRPQDWTHRPSAPS